MLRIKQLPSTLILLAAVGVSSWLLLISSHKNVTVQTSGSKTADLIMENVVVIRTDDHGFVKNRMSSPRLVHYNEPDLTNFVSPHIIFYNNKEAPWHLYSNHGQATESFATLLFWDHVKLQQTKPGAAPTTVTTSKLTMYPKKDLAITDQPAQLISGNNVVNTIGIRANTKTEQIELLSQARGYYEPAT